MIAYRDGKQIMLCDACHEKLDGGVIERDGRGREVSLHAVCLMPEGTQPFRCPDCVTTGEEVCTHERD